ncbi:MAG: hypothetical protein NC210_01260 [[Clostridium] fimetarium]|nr:hypothetical protein [Alistipes timonensis]MCM1405033.1 hypothetical protein [[Clostridium] fimetarium]
MKRIFALMLILAAMFTMVSCGDDDDDDKASALSGWYVADLPPKGSSDYTGMGYYFQNKNTLVYYNYISGQPRWTYSEQLKGLSGYYAQQGGGETYTYSVSGNKVYVPMQGRILTIDGKTLRLDGSSVVYAKR